MFRLSEAVRDVARQEATSLAHSDLLFPGWMRRELTAWMVWKEAHENDRTNFLDDNFQIINIRTSNCLILQEESPHVWEHEKVCCEKVSLDESEGPQFSQF